MATLSSFHLSTLKRLQSLPIRTANSAVYLLLGISADLHKRKLSLFHQIWMSENVSIREIAWRQYNAGRPASFFVIIVDILDLYELPSFIEVMSGHLKKIGIVKKSINFRQFGKNWLIFSMNIEYKKIKDYLRYIPDFYKEILQTWIKMGGGQTKTLSHFAEIRKQLIWGNKFIMLKIKV